MTARHAMAGAGWPLVAPWRTGDADDPAPNLELVLEPPAVLASTTSRAAAESVQGHSGRQRRAVLRFIRDAGSLGATDREIEAGLGVRAQSAIPRRWELVRAGLVRDSGRRRPTASGRSAVAWVAVGGADAGAR